ncbi:MAG TPA: hypothetical protein VEG28_04460, partial [Dehalococcoidia bacterium]|nr:hypothetical protein [Dehalococcoidia bacterium]
MNNRSYTIALNRLKRVNCLDLIKHIMEFVLPIILSVVALILALPPYIKKYATNSLLSPSNLKCDTNQNPVSDGKRNYWVIGLIIGKGNWLCKILKGWASINVVVDVKFEGISGTGASIISASSSAYNIDIGVRDRRRVFPIMPNKNKHVIVAQTSLDDFGDLKLHTMGDSFGCSALVGSYNI